MQVYYRYTNKDEKEEFEICKKYFSTVDCRSELVETSDPDNLVLPRFSALPFGKELEKDISYKNLKLLNPYYQQVNIHTMSWYYEIPNNTFKTWFRLCDVPENEYPIILKGSINSRKFEWDTMMYAETRADACRIDSALYHDPLIAPQGVIYRKYVPLVTYEIGINGMPMANEWRCFFYKGEIVAYGYYWTTLEDVSKISDMSFIFKGGLFFAKEIARILYEADIADFFVLDVAEKLSGGWVVVEVNDGQMSGLSTIDPDYFYSSLKNIINER